MLKLPERYIVDTCGTLIDKETRNTYDYPSELVDHLNFKEWKIKHLKARNKRQAEIIGDLWKLIKNKDWTTLTSMIQEMEENDKKLQKEAEAKSIHITHEKRTKQ